MTVITPRTVGRMANLDENIILFDYLIVNFTLNVNTPHVLNYKYDLELLIKATFFSPVV